MRLRRESALFPLDSPFMYVEGEDEEVIGLEIKARGRMGLLRDLATVVSGRRLFIKKFVHSNPQDDYVLIFMVIEKPETGVTSLLNELERVDGVIKIDIAPRYGRIIYTRKLHPLLFASKQAVIIGSSSMEGLTIGLSRQAGEEVASIILSSIGYQIGYILRENYSGVASVNSISDSIGFLDAILSSSGWGRVYDYKLSGSTITIVLEDNWECDIVASRRMYREPWYTKGILRGFYTELLKHHITVKFLKAWRRKGRIYCAFEIERKGEHTPASL